ncbi:MAG: hypothetical protein ACRDH2_09380, partial [Anaerolineales bacterium]
MWLAVWEELSAPHIAAANEAAARGDCEVATQEIRAALTMLAIALSGDGYYFYTPMRHRRKSLWTMRRLFAMLRKLTGARAERISVSHLHGKTAGLLHLPPGAEELPPRSLPALVALHPLGGDKDS